MKICSNYIYYYRVKYKSLDCLEHILSHEDCDVDPLNRLSGKTPLHYAVELEDGDERVLIVESLLDAGADITYGYFSERIECL